MKITVISSYPERNSLHGQKTVGVGNYTKATLLAVRSNDKTIDFDVYCEKFTQNDEKYHENGIYVSRCWTRGNWKSVFVIFIRVAKSTDKTILIPFEMYMFGGIGSVLLFLLGLGILKISGKKTIIVLHQVLGSELSIFEKNKIKTTLFSLVKKAFYSYISSMSSVVIVFEEELKSRLYNSKKVIFIPHAVLEENKADNLESRKLLNLDPDKKIVFCFGYLSPYKGFEELIKIWKKDSNYQLIIGGGGNPNHMSRPDYKKFVEKIISQANEKSILTTGFIPEDQMKLYFSAVDLVIFPYLAFISSSGPMAHAFSYEVPVLLSNSLKPYFKSPDIKKALVDAGLSEKDLLFSLDSEIETKLKMTFADIEKYIAFSAVLNKQRSWNKVAMMYVDLFKIQERI